IARTDAQAATLLTADVDERDQPFVTGERTAEGFYRVRNGIEPCIARGLAYAPYSDLLWMETSKPDLDVARAFAEGIKNVYPDQMLAFNCSPSFNWRAPGRGDHCQVRQGTRRDGLPVPVHYPGRLPRPEPLDVRPGQGFRDGGHARLRPAPAGRVRGREVWLHGHPPPARGRHRLLRPGDLGDLPARRDRGPVRLHRGRAVPRRVKHRN